MNEQCKIQFRHDVPFGDCQLGCYQEPKGGKRVSEIDFAEISEKEFKEMQRNLPAGSGRRL